MTIGERIRNRREELGMTQTDLAMKCGYSSKSSICKIEKEDKEISVARLEKISKILNISIRELMGKI